MVTRSRVLSAGSYLPARVVTNDELAKTIDTSDEWIRQRTGIRQRYIAAEGELTSDLAIAASRQALENAGPQGQRHRLHRARHLHPGPHLSGDRDARPACAGRQGLRARRRRGVLGLRVRAGGGRQFHPPGPGQERAGDRRRDLLAHPRLDRPQHLRAVRRRRRRGGAAGGRGQGRQDRPGHPLDAPVLRRRALRAALCRWRPVGDPDHRPCEDGRARGLPPRGGQPGGRDRRRHRRQPHHGGTRSTGWCRTRPTGASSTAWATG